MQKTKDQKAAEFWERMDFLIGDERPYSWAESKGIKKSAFQSARNRQSKPLAKTVELWAQQIGCSYEWLDKGIGEPFKDVVPVAQQQDKETQTESGIVEEEGLRITTSIDRDKLQQAFETTAQALKDRHKIMRPKPMAEFIVMLYEALIDKETQPFDSHLLNAAIYLVENELEIQRRTMSPEKKTLLIIAIYTLYSDDASNMEAIQLSVKSLVRSAA
ncbi:MULTISPECIES: hypothetical protein [Acinetobacter]|uniref:XRE family transcriptional regulator n=1 Tax=Acinetobacter corruptisaponis TaxID=3045147 RepID=A0ABY8S7E8_9GAMM|nr:hypothetical protein [Acinetobacter sp. KCTC 92772]WHP07008.1 hypothetical protein QLH32_05975 [Acinetobacter sp. KCTC 92772]